MLLFMLLFTAAAAVVVVVVVACFELPYVPCVMNLNDPTVNPTRSTFP